MNMVDIHMVYMMNHQILDINMDIYMDNLWMIYG